MALILVIGLALFAFVLDPSSIQDFFNSSKTNTVGEVSGETISRKEFSEALEAYKAQYGNRVSEMQASKNVWNNLVRQKIYQTQLADAGITVGEADVWNVLVENPQIRNNKDYQNEAGLFDEDKFKEFLAVTKSDNPQLWARFTSSMAQIKDNLETTTYNNLITAGLGASLKEGEMQYLNNNTKITSEFVYVPFSTVKDEDIKVTTSEIDAYVKSHAAQFEVEESRDIKLVKFDIIPTAEDEAAIKSEVANLLNDSGQSKGLKNTTNITNFFSDNVSDIALDNSYNFKNTVSVGIADGVFKGKKGDVFGPYKDRGYYKISKLTEITQMPDSVKGAHILIPFMGSASAGQDTKRTEAQAKKAADSIYKLVRRNKTKFAEIANEINPDGTKGKGGDTDWLNKNAFSLDEDFGKAFFFDKKGSVKVIKTKFGYHIIRIDESKNKQAVVKLATFARKINASQATENAIFQNAETLAFELSNSKNIDDVAKEKTLNVLSAIGLKMLDENVPNVGKQRDIIQWAFNKENEVGAYKRFDTNSGHVVAVLTNKTKAGLMSAAKAAQTVRPIIANQKKAAIIEAKMNGATLADIATANATTVKTASAVTLISPMISGIGYEPEIVGAMSSAKENVVHSKVAGIKGVFAFKVTKIEAPVKLPNYDSYRKRIADQRKAQINVMYNAIKKAANVEDNRGAFYGVN